MCDPFFGRGGGAGVLLDDEDGEEEEEQYAVPARFKSTGFKADRRKSVVERVKTIHDFPQPKS